MGKQQDRKLATYVRAKHEVKRMAQCTEIVDFGQGFYIKVFTPATFDADARRAKPGVHHLFCQFDLANAQTAVDLATQVCSEHPGAKWAVSVPLYLRPSIEAVCDPRVLPDSAIVEIDGFVLAAVATDTAFDTELYHDALLGLAAVGYAFEWSPGVWRCSQKGLAVYEAMVK